ncbi:MAG: polymer-forming cytoskeletal protein [Dehalococcoidia bacterium]|nr:polymer-forming cytoskeletal protein [Dehalococcoidia bacterium]
MQFKKGPSDRRIPEFDQADTMNQNESRAPAGEGRFSFSRSNQGDAPPEIPADDTMESTAPAAARVESLLDASSSFDGHFIAEQDLRVQGNVSGEVTCRGLLTIEQHAVASARINARDAEILGTIEGDITCTGRLRLAASSVLNGTIHAGYVGRRRGRRNPRPRRDSQCSGEVAPSSSSSASSGSNSGRSRSSNASRRNEKAGDRDEDPSEDDDTGRRSRDLPSFALVSSEEGSNFNSRSASS